ncbi:MAG: cytochrome c1 [Parvularculaceae bacterium]|nr:cytochrome c1 [Parvularculaceae bacterium]
MTVKASFRMLASAGAALFCALGAAEAAGGKTLEYKHNHWHFKGPFGTYDKEAMQRGFQVYRTVCASCHSVDQLAFRNLGEKGGPFHLDECPAGVPESTDCSKPSENPVVKAIAAEYEVTDGPDDTGDMFKRPGLPSDKIPGPYANEQQARAANGGAFPPNLALIMKARHHGPDYVYSLLTGYETPPDTVALGPTQHYNPYFAGDMSQLLKPEYLNEEGHPVEGVEIPPGGVLAMKAPLSDGIVDYADESVPETVDQYAKDVVEFLTWASEPKMEARKSLGVVSMGYLLVLTLILFFSYRTIWSRVDH